jgi:periplasmic copper chaperone A
MTLKSSSLIVAAALMATPACAHVTLEGRQAAIGSPYKAIFVVPHGCSGSATVKLRVQIPPGVIVTAAKATTGWEATTVSGQYPAELEFDGKNVSEGITEVDWSGGKLPDKTRETFVIETFLTKSLKPNTTLYFPVVQECEQGVSRWIEIPADADHPHDKKWPAPGVKLLP